MVQERAHPGPVTPIEAVCALVEVGRQFLDYAALFTPGMDGELPPIGDESRPLVELGMTESRELVRRLLEVIRFNPDWYHDLDLSPIFPALAGFIGSLDAIEQRLDLHNPAGWRVKPAELATMSRGLDAIERWQEGRPTTLPRGWDVAVDESGVGKIYIPPKVTVREQANGSYRVTIGGRLSGETYDLDTPQGLFFKAIIEADGRPVSFAQIGPTHPSLEGLNPTRDLRDRLPPPLRNLIVRAEGYRFAPENL